MRNDGTIYTSGQNISEMSEIFENYEGAELFALNTINNNPGIECWIGNSKRDHVYTFDKEGKRNYKET